MKSIRLLLLSAPLICSGAPYHVDCGRGVDSNSGVSQAAAWRSLEKVNCPEGAACGKDAGSGPAIDWKAPEFDPAKPGDFEAFLNKHRQWMMQTFERQFGRPVKLGL